MLVSVKFFCATDNLTQITLDVLQDPKYDDPNVDPTLGSDTVPAEQHLAPTSERCTRLEHLTFLV